MAVDVKAKLLLTILSLFGSLPYRGMGGLANDSLIPHLTYSFQHANIWHMLANLFVLWNIKQKMNVVSGFLIAVAASFLPMSTDRSTVGMSGLLFAMFGIMWGKPVAYVFIRPQRYTKEFIDAGDHFSLSVLGEDYRKTLNYFGTVSGRDEDKIAKSGLHVAHENGTPYFEEANTVLVCRKLYAQPYDPACFIDKSCDEKWYPNKDYHTMYIAEIEKVLVD